MVDDGGSTIERLCLLEILNLKREKQICLYYSKSYFKGGGGGEGRPSHFER